jgi:hypothetical protein
LGKLASGVVELAFSAWVEVGISSKNYGRDDGGQGCASESTGAY